MINVVIFNNNGIGIWNVYFGKKVKFFRYVISFIIVICIYCRGKILIMLFRKFLWFIFLSCVFYNEMVIIWFFKKNILIVSLGLNLIYVFIG